MTYEKCSLCGKDVALRNPSGECDHLYYPENLEIKKALVVITEERRKRGEADESVNKLLKMHLKDCARAEAAEKLYKAMSESFVIVNKSLCKAEARCRELEKEVAWGKRQYQYKNDAYDSALNLMKRIKELEEEVERLKKLQDR